MNIVFDFGAVLFAWQPQHLLRQTYPERVASEADASTLAQQVFSHPDWHDFDRGVVRMDEVIERTSARLGLPLAATRVMVTSIGARLTPMPDSVSILLALHQLRLHHAGVSGLYFLSNMPAPYAQYLQAHHPFLTVFDGGLFSSAVKLSKPEPAIYQRLIAQYSIDPAQTLLIDDLAINVAAARALGWQGIQFESAQQLRVALGKCGVPALSVSPAFDNK